MNENQKIKYWLMLLICMFIIVYMQGYLMHHKDITKRFFRAAAQTTLYCNDPKYGEYLCLF